MRDLTTFLTELYVIIDDWDKTQPPPPVRRGPLPALSRSEVLTLAVLGQWGRFSSEREFWGWADRQLRPYFPTLPSRGQFNQAARRWADALERLAVWLGQQPTAPKPVEIIDATGVVTRDCKRRGVGWLPQIAAIGRCTREGWFEGVQLLVCCTSIGAVTGFGLAPGNTNDRRLADTLLAARCTPHPLLPSAGVATTNRYLADKGFAGMAWEAHWKADYGATVLAPPERHATGYWKRGPRRRHAACRQIVESVMGRLHNRFGLSHERPHRLDGLKARVAARVCLHNVCLWLNQQANQPPLAIAEFLAW